MTVDTHIGIIRTVAGNGEPGLSGDDGPARAACLNEPKAVIVDGQGNLLIADSENHVIRKVDRLTGMIGAVAGCPMPSSSQPVTAGQKGPSPDDEDPFESDPSAEGAFSQQTDLSGTVRYVAPGAAHMKRFGG
jgi:hypothetical protein